MKTRQIKISQLVAYSFILLSILFLYSCNESALVNSLDEDLETSLRGGDCIPSSTVVVSGCCIVPDVFPAFPGTTSTVDFGDGTVITINNASGPTEHCYVSAGSYIVFSSLVDADGKEIDSYCVEYRIQCEEEEEIVEPTPAEECYERILNGEIDIVNEDSFCLYKENLEDGCCFIQVTMELNEACAFLAVAIVDSNPQNQNHTVAYDPKGGAQLWLDPGNSGSLYQNQSHTTLVYDCNDEVWVGTFVYLNGEKYFKRAIQIELPSCEDLEICE